MTLAGALVATAFTACGGGGYGSGGGGGGGGMCGGAYQPMCPPPTVSITSPAAGAVSGTVAITASATASAQYSLTIASVQFFDGATSLGTATTAPYTVNWDTTMTTNGSHTLTAKATDNRGGMATSAGVVVTVSDGHAAAAMAPSQIFPAPSSKASGVARISVETDTGAVSGAVTLSGMSARTVTINQGFAGSSGAAIVTLAPRSASEFVVPASVTLSREQTAAFAQGRLYVIATSAANPGGEIRGQLAPAGVHVTFSELSASPEAQALGMAASGVAATTVDTRAGTLTVHVNSAGVEDATAARVSNAAGSELAALARDAVEMGHFSTELARIGAADLASFEAGRLSVSVAGSATPGGAIRGAISAEEAQAVE